jgi:FixJ family two-component response regulator
MRAPITSATGLLVMEKAQPFVVVVDGDASVTRAIKRLLRSIGVKAESFANGEAFLEAMSTVPFYHPGCVILDVELPGLNGLELQRRLAGSGLPFIFITAFDDTGAMGQALSAGALGYFRKPFDDELFVETVRAALAKP